MPVDLPVNEVRSGPLSHLKQSTGATIFHIVVVDNDHRTFVGLRWVARYCRVADAASTGWLACLGQFVIGWCKTLCFLVCTVRNV